MNPLNGVHTIFSNYPDGLFADLGTWEPIIGLCPYESGVVDGHTYQKVAKCWRRCRSSVESYL